MDSPPASRQPGVSSRWFAAGLCAAAGVALFHLFGNATRGYIGTSSLFVWWGHQWTNPASETEHGWLVLALSVGVLAYRLHRGAASAGETSTRLPSERDEAAAGRPSRRWFHPAAMAMLGALLLHAAGFAAQQARLSILALLVFTWGVLRLGGGVRWGRAAVFPLGFMLFALPLGVLDSLGFGLWLRMRVVDASAAVAALAGIDVLRSGTQLLASDGSYNYDVAAACSGIRSLTAMTALSFLAGYLNFRTWWRRVLVVAVCFPLVYAGNVARIVAIIFAAEAGGPDAGDLAHEVMGFGVFAIVLGGVLGFVALLQRGWPEPASTAQESAGPELAGGAVSGKWALPLAAAVIGAVGMEMVLLSRLAARAPAAPTGVVLDDGGVNPVELPTFLGTEWIGRRAEVTPIEREILPPDTGFSRKVYVPLARPAEAVFVSVVLSGQDRTSIHRPELCLVGQGWTVTGRSTHAFRHPGAPGGEVPATILRVEREVAQPQGVGRVTQLTAYWFVGAERVVPTHAGMLAHDAWLRLTRARADRWAYVLLQTDASEGEAGALARMQAVLDAVLPGFQRPVARR